MDSQFIGESKEDYLEAIYIQIKKNGACRPTDVATFLNCSKPSVSVALKKLEQENYVIRDDWKVVLTESGLYIAMAMYKKHNFFKSWLMMAGVEEKTAEKEACHMEHVISDDSFDKICSFMKKTHGDVLKGLV